MLLYRYMLHFKHTGSNLLLPPMDCMGDALQPLALLLFVGDFKCRVDVTLHRSRYVNNKVKHLRKLSQVNTTNACHLLGYIDSDADRVVTFSFLERHEIADSPS